MSLHDIESGSEEWFDPAIYDVYFEDDGSAEHSDRPVETTGLRDLNLSAELILALDTLTEKQRFVIELRVGLRGDPEGYTQEEVGEMMGLDFSTVSDLEERAMARLHKFFT